MSFVFCFTGLQNHTAAHKQQKVLTKLVRPVSVDPNSGPQQPWLWSYRPVEFYVADQSINKWFSALCKLSWQCSHKQDASKVDVFQPWWITCCALRDVVRRGISTNSKPEVLRHHFFLVSCVWALWNKRQTWIESFNKCAFFKTSIYFSDNDELSLVWRWCWYECGEEAYSWSTDAQSHLFWTRFWPGETKKQIRFLVILN